MATIAISTDFMESLAILSKTVQNKVLNFFDKFQANPNAKGINLEKINTPYDEKIYSVRIDKAYRGIVAKISESDTYMLLWVDHHDKAYDWAQNKKVKINPNNSVYQLYTVATLDTKEDEIKVETLFGKYSNSDLLKIGVPEELIPWVKLFPDKEAFFAGKNKLPTDAFESLEWLVNDLPLEEVIRLYQSQLKDSEEMPVTPDPMKNPITMKSFVVVDSQEELRRVLSEPLEKWRIFLHPDQRKLVSKNFNGSARVLGGAGTGKTVVAMHRAKWLSNQLPEDKKVLFTAYNANLAADIKELLRKICTSTELNRIEVITLDAWMSRFLKNHGFNYDVFSGELKKVWEEAIHLAGNEAGFSAEFYENEWLRVVCSQEAFTREKYLKTSRIGRGTGLNRIKRLQVWKVFNEYMTLMKNQRRRDPEWAKYECISIIQQQKEKLNYGAIIVDEAQDMSAESFRLMRSIIGESHPNDIFIVGDSHQRIYKNHAVLSKCGIDVKGRSSYLRINYRTTEEIRKYAYSLLKGFSFDDLDGNSNNMEIKCQSIAHGDEPKIMNFKTLKEESDYIITEIHKLLDQGMMPGDICITARTNGMKNSYQKLLREADLETYEIKTEKQDDRSFGGIRLATMHRVKGLEFAAVFLAGINDGTVPSPQAIDHTDAVSEEESLKAERSLMYVALTRARNHAYITSFGKTSEFL